MQRDSQIGKGAGTYRSVGASQTRQITGAAAKKMIGQELQKSFAGRLKPPERQGSAVTKASPRMAAPAKEQKKPAQQNRPKQTSRESSAENNYYVRVKTARHSSMAISRKRALQTLSHALAEKQVPAGIKSRVDSGNVKFQ